MKRIVTCIAAIVLAMVGCSRSPKVQEWHIYKGSIPGYSVNIEDTAYENGKHYRIVHLEATDKSVFPSAITGHDYGADFSWDRIFIQKTSAGGFNSVYFHNGQQEYEPCEGDKTSSPFTPAQLIDAKLKLEESLSVGKEENEATPKWK